MQPATPGLVKKQPKQLRKSAATPDDILHQLAFENSLQANIITIVSTGRIIMANKAAAKLLKCSVNMLLTKSRSGIFAIEEKNFKKMLKQRSADGHSTAFVTAITKTGKQVPCEITSAVFAGTDRVKKAITTITDISKRIQKQKSIDTKKAKTAEAKTVARLAENNEWIKYIAKASYDVMWDWDVSTGEVYVGESVKEIFGYKVKYNTISFNNFLRCLLPEDTIAVEKKILRAMDSAAKTWSDAYVLRRKDGSLAATVSRASIIRDENGKAVRVIGATQDVSTVQELEKKLEIQTSEQIVYSERFSLLARLSFDGIWDWNILSNEFFLGEGFEELFGYTYNTPYNIALDWNSFVHPDDRLIVENEIKEALASTALQWEFAFRITRADDTVAFVFNRASIVRDSDGKACRMIGVIRDLSSKRGMEEKLEQEIQLKEKQMEEAMEDAEDAARTYIGKELHDNVNQLLGASRMFIELAKRGGENSGMYLQRSSDYTLMAIEDIRKLTRGLNTEIVSNLGLCAAIENAVEDIKTVSTIKMNFVTEGFIESGVSNKFKLNIYRIVQEQLNNILKHAQAGTVGIHLTQSKKSITLSIVDNGIGFDTTVKRKGIGIANMKSRAAAFNGRVHHISAPGTGCILTATFPVSETDNLNQAEARF
jgi:PAS domain S-box-containing protein